MTSIFDSLTSTLQAFSASGLTKASTAVRNEIISKARDVIFALQTPEQHVLELSTNYVEVVAIRTIMRMKVLEILPEDSGLSLQELVQKTGAQESLLERLLRILVGTRFFSQDSEGKYHHTHISKGYLGPAGAWMVGILYGTTMRFLYSFPTEYMDAHPELGFTEPESPAQNPITFTWNGEGTNMWELFKDHPQVMTDFQKGMGMMKDSVPVTGFFDFGKLVKENDEDKSRTVLVDVGGGVGQCLEKILSAHPEIPPERCVLQDLPQTLESWNFPNLPASLKKMPHNFFEPQPIKNAKAYFFRWVFPDWSDANCIKILEQIVPVMGKDSVLLINDVVSPERLSEGTVYAGFQDMAMLAVGGKARTLKGFEKLFTQVGLKLAKVHEVEGEGSLGCHWILEGHLP